MSAHQTLLGLYPQTAQQIGVGLVTIDRPIHQCARAQRDALFSNTRMHVGEDRFGQSASLKTVPEVEYGGLIRDAIIVKLDPCKRANCLASIQRLLGYRVAHGIPVLQEVNAQRGFQWHRRSPALQPTL